MILLMLQKSGQTHQLRLVVEVPFIYDGVLAPSNRWLAGFLPSTRLPSQPASLLLSLIPGSFGSFWMPPSKVVSTYLWNTPLNHQETGYKGIPFIVG